MKLAHAVWYEEANCYGVSKRL